MAVTVLLGRLHPRGRMAIEGHMLTSEEFYSWLDADPKAARRLLERIRERLLKFFVWNGCREPDDCAAETVLRVLVAAARGTCIQKPEAYFLGVARNVLKECRRRQLWLKRLLDVAELDPPSPRGGPDLERIEILESCLALLSDLERRLIREHHEEGDALGTIAQRLRMTANAVGIRLFNARRKLLECLRRKAA